MNTTIKIEIINPKAIAIREETKKGFAEVLKKLRANAKSAPNLGEITNEVEIVRTKRYEKKS